MQAINLFTRKENITDIDKGQKIIAAIYLVTGHLPESDPLKRSLREASTMLVGTSAKEAASTIKTYLGAAMLAGLISEKNSSIIVYELQQLLSRTSADVGEKLEVLLAAQENSDATKRSQMSYRPKPLFEAPRPTPKNHEEIVENKNKRQQTILSFINERKSAGIKDIAALFPGLSEKTVQRELGVLVSTGKITKRGNKRWSVYMSVGA
jgi:hypothetical protein